MSLAFIDKRIDCTKRGRVKFLVACGGTAGHYLPALSFAESLRKKADYCDIKLVLTKRKIEQEADLGDFKAFHLSLVPISLRVNFKNLAAIGKFFQGSFESLYLILKFNPDIVVGFGSYASFPLLFFAALLGKKILIHEQNVKPGVANRLLSLLANKIAVSFPESKKYFCCRKNKIIFTGNPVRSDLFLMDKHHALRYFNLAGDRLTLLVMGGSQGSHKINTELIGALSELDLDGKLQVIHLSGERDYYYLKDAYAKTRYAVRLFAFLKEMSFAYNAADLVISRSGASSINEIIYYRLPAILIPYPYAGRHQRENAKVLHDRGACIIIEDTDFRSERLQELLMQFLSHREDLNNLRSGLNSLSRPDAAEELSNLVLSLN
ncbi:MAG: undecaprenyldiphospho-muramoylpentapeptide beta-N-acetylglucosaminyltransferase [Candidatus Omnitrophica bacterium]|nr:undecaprenyldiphospho-muramoylpentapeptide beta-N-acetylglucosaminyltransferase [Candidatus Omnitrophota bacterium]